MEWLTLVFSYIAGVTQDHPRHDKDLFGHSLAVASKLSKINEYLGQVGWLHDVGKVTTKARHKSKPQDCFYGHAKASIAWIEANKISVDEFQKILILHHDDLIGVKSEDKFIAYATGKHPAFVINLLSVIEADLKGQNQSNSDVLDDLIWIEKFRSIMGGHAKVDNGIITF
jgi:hypothetical protein